MADNIDRQTTAPAAPPPAPRRKRWGLRILAVLLLGPALVIGLWMAITLSYTYSDGERAGYVKKFSRKGWLCKTWEGELSMANIPLAPADIFPFSVRDEVVARQVEAAMGNRVTLSYKQHKGIPTSCFGETEYFVSNVRVVGGDNSLFVPIAPGASAAPPIAPVPAPR